MTTAKKPAAPKKATTAKEAAPAPKPRASRAKKAAPAPRPKVRGFRAHLFGGVAFSPYSLA